MEENVKMAKKTVTSEILNIEPIDLGYLNYCGITEECLAGKTAVVTGGASNVGLGYARALAWSGANVVVADLNETAGNETQRVINEENGRDCCLFVKVNVTSQEDITNLKEKAFAKFGKVDILINNAMNMRLNGPVLTSKVEDLESSFQISAKGVMMAIQAFVPGMIERGYGVVTYSATQFHYCPPMVGGTIYTAGKAAATSLIMSLANEVKGKGVYVFCLTPAGVARIDFSKMPAPPAPKPGDPPMPKFDPAMMKKMMSMPGFDGMVPPEAGGAAMVYSILNAEKLHGSGFLVSDAFNAMNYPYPVPETVMPPVKGHRLTDMELTMAFCTMGPGFDA
jgi:NAD(P)-dependent dehydrogenase (short-subunit alcohol dehydrogenase family)